MFPVFFPSSSHLMSFLTQKICTFEEVGGGGGEGGCVAYAANRPLQCAIASSHCDGRQQCVDGSDEHGCEAVRVTQGRSKALPILVEFQPTGDIATRSLQSEAGSVDVSCPEMHFWCPDKDYCLPVFVRCNGVYDCPGHEDEEGCDLYTCPGLYRCRASKVCLHVTHVCDDWPLCPQLDDELLCGQQCPPQCTCHGLALFCHQVFAADEHPDLRYLDARGSGMSVHQLSGNQMLVHLSLSTCSVRAVSNFSFHNLHSLDLSDNLLTQVSSHQFRHMPHLTALFLAGNPFISVFMLLPGSSFGLQNIRSLDVSRVKLGVIVYNLVSVFPNLHILNLSHSGIDLLQWSNSDVSVPSLRELDLRGCVIAEFPGNLLRRFSHLQLLFTDNFKLCCPAVLRPGFDLNQCHVNPDHVSSCDNLLGSVTYRATIAVLATLSLLGNVVSLTWRVCIRSTWQLSSGGVVLTHLSVADLGMGLYLATLGLADRLLAGQYVWQDNTWRRGAVCHLAGALALSCRHAAIFFISILSVDRCLYRIPTLIPRLTPAKVKVICVVAWAVSLNLAVVPIMSRWFFFGQQALCVPLPHTMDGSLESAYTHGTVVYVCLVMLTLGCVCEGVSSVSVRLISSKNFNKDTHSNESKFILMGSLTSGFLFTITCLLATDFHTDRQAATHTALVYFEFVISCAMNPYLHLYSVWVERNKRIKEERLLKIVNRSRV